MNSFAEFQAAMDEVIPTLKRGEAGYTLSRELIGWHNLIIITVKGVSVPAVKFAEEVGLPDTTCGYRLKRGAVLGRLFLKGTTKGLSREEYYADDNPYDAVSVSNTAKKKRLTIDPHEAAREILALVTVKESLLVGRSKMFPAITEEVA